MDGNNFFPPEPPRLKRNRDDISQVRPLMYADLSRSEVLSVNGMFAISTTPRGPKTTLTITPTKYIYSPTVAEKSPTFKKTRYDEEAEGYDQAIEVENKNEVPEKPLPNTIINSSAPFFNSFGPKQLQVILSNKFEDLNPLAFYKLNYVIRNLKGEHNQTFRNLIEPIGAKDQCEYVLKEARNGTSGCWLCGYNIDNLGKYISNPWKLEKPNPQASNAPECEHLLPAAAAAVIYSLLESKKDTYMIFKQGNKRTKVDVTPFYSQNYRWSHRLCNVLKSDQLFVNFIHTDNTIDINPHINTKNIDGYLNSLYEKDEIKRMLRTQLSKTQWINERKKSIIKQLTPLVNTIQTFSSQLALLLNVGEIMNKIDTNFDKFESKLRENPDNIQDEFEPKSNKQILYDLDILKSKYKYVVTMRSKGAKRTLRKKRKHRLTRRRY